MKSKRLILLPLAGLLTLGLASCVNSGGKSTEPDGGNCPAINDTPGEETKLPTPETDALEFDFEDDYDQKDYYTIEEGQGVVYGKATLVQVTDGDTAVFKSISNQTMRVRFMAINTPESTAKVEPWGVKASHWCKETLNSAVDFCLVNDTKAYNAFDSSGGRHMAFVWYKTTSGDWRLYNLECVEQGYSTRQLFVDSDLKYLPAFKAADERMKGCKYRCYGAQDPTYDYEGTVTECTIYEVHHRYDELGITDASSGKQLRITALVVGLLGDNMVLRDVVHDLEQAEDDPYETIYAYAGFKSSLASFVGVGDVVRFYCRATTYSDNIQLSDVKTGSVGKHKFDILVDASEGEDYGAYYHDISPDDLTTVITDAQQLAEYKNCFVALNLKIRNVTTGDRDDDGNIIGEGTETYYNQSSKSPFSETIYAYLNNATGICNIRIDGNCSPKLSHSDFQVGHVYRVCGYLATYYDKYQIQLFNNYAGSNYVTEVQI